MQDSGLRHQMAPGQPLGRQQWKSTLNTQKNHMRAVILDSALGVCQNHHNIFISWIWTWGGGSDSLVIQTQEEGSPHIRSNSQQDCVKPAGKGL